MTISSEHPAKKVERVMISSTTLDLPEHREKVKDACIRLGMLPLMMEYLPANGNDAIEASLKLVNEADVYVGVFAHRYGHVPTGHEISITEREYDRAVERGITCLIFIMHDKHPVTILDVEQGINAIKLDKLKKRASTSRVVNFFTSPGDLEVCVINSLVKWREAESIVSRDSDKMLEPPFDVSYYVNTFIQQYENYGLGKDVVGIVSPIFTDQLFRVYVPLGFENEHEEFFPSLDEYIEGWLTDDARRNVVLLGDYGSGKTSYCLFLCHRLLLKYQQTNDGILPIYLNFRDIVLGDLSNSPTEKIFDVLVNQYNMKLGEFSNFSAVLKSHKFLLILDGLDEIVSSLDIDQIHHKFSTLREILLYCYKVIITCRTNYFYSESEVHYIFPLSAQNIDFIDTMVGIRRFELLYLSEVEVEQREIYLRNRIKDDQKRLNILKAIDEIKDLSGLSRRPILLRMIVDSLEDSTVNILQAGQDTITQTRLYYDYSLTLLRREAPRHISQGRPILKTDDKFVILERLALQLWRKELWQIQREDLKDFLLKSFHGRYHQSDIDQIEYAFVTCSFLMRTGDNYFGFAHRSFLEFFVARALHTDILTDDFSFFAQKRLFGVIAVFLKELIDQDRRKEALFKRLKEWLVLSYDSQKQGPYLAGNCSSLLCRLGVSFEGLDLSHIVFKDADLTGANFSQCILRNANFDGSILVETNFSDSDLQGANLNNIFIKKTLFRRSNLHEASFKNIRMIGGPNTIWKAAFTIDKANIAIGTDSGDFIIIPFGSMGIKAEKRLHIDETAVLHFAFSPDGKLVAIADRSNLIHLYEWEALLNDPIPLPQVFSDNDDYVRWLDFSPNSDILASGARDHRVKLWYLKGRTKVKELNFHSAPVMYTLWSPDGKHIATAGYDKHVCLWHIHDKNVPYSLLHDWNSETAHTDIVRALAFSKNGTLLASAGQDNVIKLWDLSSSMPKLFTTPIKTENHVFCVEFIENDKTLIIGDDKGFIARVPIDQGQLTHTIHAHEDMLRSFSVDEQNGFLLTASWDGCVKLWNLADLTLINDRVYHLDQEEILYTPADAFSGARIKDIQNLSEVFRKCFIKLGAIDE